MFRRLRQARFLLTTARSQISSRILSRTAKVIGLSAATFSVYQHWANNTKPEPKPVVPLKLLRPRLRDVEERAQTELIATANVAEYLNRMFPRPPFLESHANQDTRSLVGDESQCNLLDFIRAHNVRLFGSSIIFFALGEKAGFVPSDLDFLAYTHKDAERLLVFLCSRYGYEYTESLVGYGNETSKWRLTSHNKNMPPIDILVYPHKVNNEHYNQPYVFSFQANYFDGYHVRIYNWGAFKAKESDGFYPAEVDTEDVKEVREKWIKRGWKIWDVSK